jgi:hypothetical protein
MKNALQYHIIEPPDIQREFNDALKRGGEPHMRLLMLN